MTRLFHRSFAVAFAALAAVASAHADDITPDPYRDMPRSSLTRADVKAELRAAGWSAAHGEDSGSFALARAPRDTTTSRATVVAELKAARASGEMAALHGEDSGSAYYARAYRANGDTIRWAGR